MCDTLHLSTYYRISIHPWVSIYICWFPTPFLSACISSAMWNLWCLLTLLWSAFLSFGAIFVLFFCGLVGDLISSSSSAQREADSLEVYQWCYSVRCTIILFVLLLLLLVFSILFCVYDFWLCVHKTNTLHNELIQLHCLYVVLIIDIAVFSQRWIRHHKKPAEVLEDWFNCLTTAPACLFWQRMVYLEGGRILLGNIVNCNLSKFNTLVSLPQ
jgi:hypothetical protein